MTRLFLLALAVGLTLTGCGALLVAPQAVLSLPEAARQYKVLKDKVLPPEEQVPNDQRLAALGATALANGDLTRAEINLDAALVINPYNAHALYYLGSVYQRTSRQWRARELYTRLIALNSDASALADTPGAKLGERLVHVARMNLIEIGSAHRPGVVAPPGPEDAERAIVSRFATLMRLRDQKLITKKEYATRRKANLGALLPMTAPPPTSALIQPAPSADDIIVRLNAISRFKDSGSITETEYAAERAAILNALLPTRQGSVATPRQPPVDTRPHLDRLSRLYSLKLITANERNRERAALTARPAAVAYTATQTSASKTTAAKRKSADSIQPAKGSAGKSTVAAVPPARPKPDAPVEARFRGRKSASTTDPPKGAMGVHIASFRTPARAKRSWEELRKKYGDVFATLDSRIARVELADKGGVFFQLRAGPLEDTAAAQTLCSELKRRKLYCEPTVF